MSRLNRVRNKAAQQAEESTASPEDFLRRGDEGLKQSEVERQKAKDKRSKNPFRFYLKAGEEAEVIILDESLNDVVFFHEHAIKQNGKWGSAYEICVKEKTACPLCDLADAGSGITNYPYYVMMLTVIDTRGFTTKDGEKVPYSRKLLPIKNMQQPEFTRLLKMAEEEHGTLQGIAITLARDNAKEAAIGKPSPVYSGGRIYDFLTEEDFDEFYNEEVKGDDGKVIVPEGAHQQPFDYLKVFNPPDPDRLRRLYGGKAVAGSDEDDGWEEEERPARGARAKRREANTAEEPPAREEATGRSRRRTAAQEPEEDTETEEAPARGRRARTKAKEEPPARGRTRRAAKKSAEPEEEVDVEEELDDDIPF